MKVCMKNNEAMIVFYVQTGSFGQMTQYTANLNRDEFYYTEGDKEILLDWKECYPHIEENFGDFISDVEARIFNNMGVMSSYELSNDQKNYEKAKSHLENNRKLLEALKKYKQNKIS